MQLNLLLILIVNESSHTAVHSTVCVIPQAHFLLTLTVPVTTIDALQHFETG